MGGEGSLQALSDSFRSSVEPTCLYIGNSFTTGLSSTHPAYLITFTWASQCAFGLLEVLYDPL